MDQQQAALGLGAGGRMCADAEVFQGGGGQKAEWGEARGCSYKRVGGVQ